MKSVHTRSVLSPALECGLFKHWIGVNPSHYGLLYYIKGDKPRVFNRDLVRTPVQKCRHCGRDVKDYGGHKKYLDPKGLNLTDVWDDVPPVRQCKYKNRPANELAPIVFERIVKLTTNPGDLICDPFAGGGVTAYVAERLQRRWIVGDINDCAAIKGRLISWEQGSHPEWETNKKRIAEPVELPNRASRVLPLLDGITH